MNNYFKAIKSCIPSYGFGHNSIRHIDPAIVSIGGSLSMTQKRLIAALPWVYNDQYWAWAIEGCYVRAASLTIEKPSFGTAFLTYSPQLKTTFWCIESDRNLNLPWVLRVSTNTIRSAYEKIGPKYQMGIEGLDGLWVQGLPSPHSVQVYSPTTRETTWVVPAT